MVWTGHSLYRKNVEGNYNFTLFNTKLSYNFDQFTSDVPKELLSLLSAIRKPKTLHFRFHKLNTEINFFFKIIQ